MEWLVFLQGLAVSVGVPLLSAFVGWLNKALADGVIQALEWRKLAETVIRVGVPAFAAYLGLNTLGLDVNALAPVLVAALIDWYRIIFRNTAREVNAKKK